MGAVLTVPLGGWVRCSVGWVKFDMMHLRG